VGTGSALLPLIKTAGSDVVGIDWRIQIDDARRILGPDIAVQGNFDPTALFAPIPEIKRRVKDILDRAGDAPGHIFNLGHGILPPTPEDHAKALIEAVHAYRRK